MMTRKCIGMGDVEIRKVYGQQRREERRGTILKAKIAPQSVGSI